MLLHLIKEPIKQNIMNHFFESVLVLTPTVLLLITLFICIRFYLTIQKYLLIKTKYYQKKIEAMERKE